MMIYRNRKGRFSLININNLFKKIFKKAKPLLIETNIQLFYYVLCHVDGSTYARNKSLGLRSTILKSCVSCVIAHKPQCRENVQNEDLKFDALYFNALNFFLGVMPTFTYFIQMRMKPLQTFVCILMSPTFKICN